jgi:hypothetical protein
VATITKIKSSVSFDFLPKSQELLKIRERHLENVVISYAGSHVSSRSDHRGSSAWATMAVSMATGRSHSG